MISDKCKNFELSILHIAPAYHDNGGGIFEVVENLTAAQSKINQIKIDILCARKNSNYLSNRNIFPDLPSHPFQLGKVIKLYFFLAENISKYDIIHIHGAWSFQFLYLIPFVIKNRKKIIYQPHGLLDPIRNKKNRYIKIIAWFVYQKYLLSSSKAIIACSTKESNELNLLTYKRSSVYVIPNGIDSIFFNAQSCTNRYKNRILFLSQIIPIKNIENIIHAISRIKSDTSIDLYLDIYGYGKNEYINELDALISRMGVKENIIFKGAVARDLRLNVYDSYRYFILASYSENFAIAVLEALSRNCITIVSNMTPWKNFSHRNLRIISTDIDSIFNILMKEIISSEVNYNYLVNIEEELIIEDYNWEAVAFKFMNFYTMKMGWK